MNIFLPALVVSALLGLAGLCVLLTRRNRRDRELARRRQEDLARQVTELKHRIAQAQRMEAVGVYAGSIVHNLNNLLAVILGHARLAAQAAGPANRGQVELEKVLRAGRLAGDLVRDLGDFYRQADRQRKPLDLGPIVRDTIKLLQDIFPSTVRIEADLQPCGKVLAAPTGIQQILLNLCSNSVQSMLGDQGSIRIELAEEVVADERKALPRTLSPGNYVRLSVRDSGRGMDPATLEKITATYFGQGGDLAAAGLGLATVCRILDDHEGAAIPTSGLGQGTTFVVYFPLIAWSVPAPPEQAVPAEPASSPPEPGQAIVQARVLIVDDEEMVAEVLAKGLRRLGYQVATTTDSRRALDLFREAPDGFDVVVTDQIMPHMSGVRLTREIHALRPGMPVVLSTGFRDSYHERQARQAGVREFILKPYSHHDLSSLIQRVLARAMEGRG